ncbi:MAG: hypothetical protein PHT41_02500 [Candidatus Omnitrophica bacterium]|nr:hypothetical protein [Candidatus Omnitrophota bacterium]MDD5238020.1 hypothetical protein [Candidatus Omnitrophota bacterium]
MRKRKIFRVSNLCIVLLIALSFILPPEAFAARRRAGGGELAHFDFGNYAAGIGIGVGAMAVGGVINAGLSSALGNVTSVGKGVLTGTAIPSITTQSSNILTAMGNSLSYSFTTTGLITNMSTFMAVSQVGRAVGAAGSYYGWKPSTTFLVSSFASGAVGGFMNPSVALGPSVSEGITNSIIPGVHYTLNPANYTLGNMLNGAFVGGVTGLASGAVIVGIDGNKINEGKQPGVGAQIAGMVTGVAVGNLTRTLIDPTTYTRGPKETWERVDNPEIKKNQNLADTSMAKAGELQAQASNKFKIAAGLGAAKSLYNDYNEGGLKNLDLKGALKGAWDSGVAATAGDVKAIQGELNTAQGYAKTAASLGGRDSTRYAYRHVLDADVWNGYAQPDGKRTPIKYEMAGDKIRHYSPNDVMANGKTYKVTPLPGKDFVTVTETGIRAPVSLVGQRLFEATFVNTADMWPQLVTNSLIIAATNSLGKKQKWMAPLISGVVGGISGPLLNNLADVYALRPGIYVGENHIGKSLANIELVGGLGFKEKLGPTANAMYSKLDNYLKDHKYAASQDDASLKELKNDLQGVLQDHGYKTNLSYTSVEGQLKEAVRNNLLSEEEASRRLNTHRENVKTPAGEVFGLAMGAANLETQEMMHNKSVSQGLSDLGTSRFQLFLNNTSRDMAYGLVEGVVTGGIQSLANKVSEKSPFAAVGVAYGANMVSAAVRGIIWHATWTPAKNQLNDLIWMNKYSLAVPEKYGSEPRQDDRVWTALNDYTYPRDLNKIEEFKTLTGLSPVRRTREIFEKTAKGVVKTKQKEMQVYELTLGLEYPDKKIVLQPDATREQIRDIVSEARKLDLMPEISEHNGRTEVNIFDRYNKLSSSPIVELPGIDGIDAREIRPSLNVSILASLAQANQQFLTESFSFGTPVVKPENMTSLHLTNYLGNMRGYAMTAISADARFIPSTRIDKHRSISFEQSMESCKEKFGSIKKLLGGHPKKAIDKFYSKRPKEDQPLAGWLTPGIVYGYIGAGSTATSINILTTMGAVRPLADAFNIQHQRLVLTNSAVVPVTVQNLDYEPWLAARKTSFYAPFPSDSFSARNKRGKTFLPGR